MTTFTHAGSGATVTYPAGHRLHDVFTTSPDWVAATTRSGPDTSEDETDTPEEEVSDGGGKRTAARGGRRRTQAAAD